MPLLGRYMDGSRFRFIAGESLNNVALALAMRSSPSSVIGDPEPIFTRDERIIVSRGLVFAPPFPLAPGAIIVKMAYP